MTNETRKAIGEPEFCHQCNGVGCFWCDGSGIEPEDDQDVRQDQ